MTHYADCSYKPSEPCSCFSSVNRFPGLVVIFHKTQKAFLLGAWAPCAEAVLMASCPICEPVTTYYAKWVRCVQVN